MEQVIFGGYTEAALSATDTKYNSPISGYLWQGIELYVYKLVSTDGKIKNLRVKLDGSPGVGTKYTFALMVNGAPSALTVEIADGATSGSNMVNKIVVSPGDTVSIRCVPANTPTVRYATWSCVFEGDIENESLILGGSLNPLSTTVTRYGQVMCARTAYTATENDFRQVVPTAGTIKNFYVKLSEDPGTDPEGYRFTLRKNGVSQALTVTITADATTGSDLVNTVDVVAGDVLTLMVEPLNAPSVAPSAVWGMTFVADIDGESIVLGGGSDDLHNANTEYNKVTGETGTLWSTNEALKYLLGQVCTLKKLYILLSAAPGVGNTYTFTLRISDADSNVVAAVTGAATTGNSGALEDDVDNDEYVDLQVVPADTPDAADAYWGFVAYREPPPAVAVKPVWEMLSRGAEARHRMKSSLTLKLG